MGKEPALVAEDDENKKAERVKPNGGEEKQEQD